ncbi:class I SAM-dependent methyltransferase [Marinobacterium rhizophilum]|uniref:Ribosomal RNA small subunit methyltransferase J n=1 Tax=Marinobacterium rhizophilum TaxID=420402 RepID=A0ABY5HPY7_9GAMM|nr:class I SAM-dependent methyltransferase [Marinobacterium rhizophilum]UTW14039.1 class I SAM-dependent methyltransferase [Marinobacterium rhizophilum]
MTEFASLAVEYVTPEHLARARQLAATLGLELLCGADLGRCDYDSLLRVTDAGLQLQPTGRKAPGPVWVDFVGGAVGHRRLHGGGTGQLIAKAVGMRQGVRPRVADVTAGLGRDSFVLASLGCDVQMIERVPVIQLLLADGLARAQQDAEVADIVARMQLIEADSISWLAQQASQDERPQVVYVDPMFPHSDKSALVKKEMRLFRDLVGDDADAARLLEAALAAAANRVVVKRPRKAPVIPGPAPSVQLAGKSSRYDIYALKKLA